jgi:hypothetical protein
MSKIKVDGIEYIVPLELRKHIDFTKDDNEHYCFCGFHGTHLKILEHVRIEHRNLLRKVE